MAGSWVHGTAHRESDVDLYVLGSGPDYRLEWHGDLLFSISYRTVEQVETSFREPFAVGSVVLGWREAVILRDPEGVAVRLKQEAADWTWDTVGEQRCNAAVAEAITGLAEEVHKLVVSRELSDRWTAAVQRSILGLRLAPIMALRLRLLYGSENWLWDIVAQRLGEGWGRAQGAALADEGQGFEERCRGALQLYGMAAESVRDLLSPDQLEVVGHACAVAGYSLGRRAST
jgi:hypothetical protein